MFLFLMLLFNKKSFSDHLIKNMFLFLMFLFNKKVSLIIFQIKTFLMFLFNKKKFFWSLLFCN